MIDVPHSGGNPGTALWQYDNNNTDAQKWCVSSNNDGTYSIASKCNRLYMDVQTANIENGTPVQCNTKNKTQSQKFKLRRCSKDSPQYSSVQSFPCGNLEALITKSTAPNSVLLIEINNFHGECLPGYAKYFVDLGYSVDVLLQQNAKDCFDLFEKTNKLKIYTFTNHDEIQDNKLILQTLLNKYKHVFLNTSDYNSQMIDSLKLLEMPQIIAVTHHTRVAKSDKFKNLLKNKRIVTLGKFNIGTYVNPHYFGKTEEHVKNKKTNFVAVGSIVSSRRNYDELIEAVTELKNKGLDFKVTIFGRAKNRLEISKDLEKYFDFKGRLSYKDMYKTIENSDFILMLLDPKNDRHCDYKSSRVSGNIQLAYGFSKPPVINKEFSDFYRLTPKNSAIYKNNLAAAMEKAINCDKKEYSSMQSNLRELSKSIFQESLNNLKTITKRVS